MKNWDLGRRDLLKHLGLGAAMLPALRTSKAWAQAGRQAASKKLILFLASEGYVINSWRPKTGSLMDQTLPPSSSPLEPFKSYVNFLHPHDQPQLHGGRSAATRPTPPSSGAGKTAAASTPSRPARRWTRWSPARCP